MISELRYPSPQRMRRPAAALLAALLLTSAQAAAAPVWRVEPTQSRLDVAYLEDGAQNQGAFERFAGEGRFDPARPAEAELTLTIDVRSLRLPDTFRTEFVQSDGWFDSRNHPEARFQLTRLTALGGARYSAEGLLTIKGRSQPLATELTLEIEGARARATGSATFDRIDFLLGDTLGLIIDIGRDIEVRFDVVATRIGG